MQRRSNVVLLELIVVLLFFSLASTIAMQAFVKADQRSKESVRMEAGLAAVESWAERVSVSGDPEAMLAAAGWKRGDGVYTLDSELPLRIDIAREDAPHGQMLRMVVSALGSAEGDPVAALPIDRYLPKPEGGDGA